MSNIMFLEAQDPDIHQTKLPQICTNARPRAREQLRIALENKVHNFNEKLAQRIQEKRPFYNHYEFLEVRIKNLAYLENMSIFPEKFKEQRKALSTKYGAKLAQQKMGDGTLKGRAAATRFGNDPLPKIGPKTIDFPVTQGKEEITQKLDATQSAQNMQLEVTV